MPRAWRSSATGSSSATAGLASSARRVAAQGRVLGHDHDLVEEGVDRRLQRREAAQVRRRSRRARTAGPARAAARCSASTARARAGSCRSRGSAHADRLALGRGLAQDVGDALVGRGEAAASGMPRKAAPPRAARHEVEAVVPRLGRLDSSTAVDLVRRVALLAQQVLEALVEEVAQSSSVTRPKRSSAPRTNARRAAWIEAAQLERRAALLDQDADHAQRRAPQAERVLVAGRPLRRCRTGRRALELVGERDARCSIVAVRAARRPRSAAGSAARSRRATARLLAVVTRVVAAHRALQLGELAHHVGRRGRPSRAAPRGRRSRRVARRCAQADLIATARRRSRFDALELACRACCGRRPRRAAARALPAGLLAVLVEEELARRPGAGAPRARCRRRCCAGRPAACC